MPPLSRGQNSHALARRRLESHEEYGKIDLRNSNMEIKQIQPLTSYGAERNATEIGTLELQFWVGLRVKRSPTFPFLVGGSACPIPLTIS